MDVDGRKWFVDAWAVHDGKIFASWRLPDTATSYLKSAESTIFMSVPDLQPVPVGRITTALRATRSGFQDRLRAANGAEIPFDDLKQIRDLVRRGYLGGGLGPAAASALAGPGPLPVGDGAAGAMFIREMIEDAPWTDGGQHIPTTAPPHLERIINDFAIAVLLAWDDTLGQESEARRRFWTFAQQLTWAGVFADDRPIEALLRTRERAGQFGANHVAEALDEMTHSSVGWRYSFDPALNRAPRGLYTIAPLPRLDSWDRRVTRLSEMSTLPAIDRRFWDRKRTALDIAPLVLVARLSGSPVVGQLGHELPPSERVFHQVRPSLNQVRLPEDAELALADFFDWCLDGAPTDDGPHGSSVAEGPVEEQHVEDEQHQEILLAQPESSEDYGEGEALGYA